MSKIPEIKGIYSEWKENDSAKKEDRLFDVKLTEDEVDQCVHSINELCEGFIKNDGVSIKDPQIQSYLELANKLNRLFIEQK